MSIEAMKQALEALEWFSTQRSGRIAWKHLESITALRQAIAEAEKQDTRSAAYWDWAGWKSSQSKSEKQEPTQTEIELGRAYRCIQAMHNAMRTLPANSFPFAYHSLTIGAAKRFVYEGHLDGSEYFIGKPVNILHDALALPHGIKGEA